MVFPPQEFFNCSNANGEGDKDGCLIGCWKIQDAQTIAKELRANGFKVRLWGRGHRDAYYHYEYMPLSIATHAAVYIKKPECFEEKHHAKEQPRLACNTPFSVRLVAYETELKKILLVIQAAKDRAFIDPKVERRISELVEVTKAYAVLSTYGFEEVKRPRWSKRLGLDRNNGKTVLSLEHIKLNIAADLIALSQFVHGYYRGVDVFELLIGSNHVYVKALHIPVEEKEKLFCVHLKDGTAWVTEEAMQLLKQKFNF
jgi:hypothetical protein